MRYLSSAICLALCAPSVLAADFGIGVSAKSDDAWIYAPIAISETFRLEPSLRYSSSKTTSNQSSAGSFSIIDDSRVQDLKSLEFGIGAFGLTKMADSTRVYYGARVAYVDAESTFTDTSAFGSGPPLVSHGKSSQDGYRAGPAIGFEYLFGSHLSIGGEASYMFLDVEGDSRSTSSSSDRVTTGKFDQKTHGTLTQLILRYQF